MKEQEGLSWYLNSLILRNRLYPTHPPRLRPA